MPVVSKVITFVAGTIPCSELAPRLTAAGSVSVCATLATVSSKRTLPSFPLAGKLLKAKVTLPLVVAV